MEHSDDPGADCNPPITMFLFFSPWESICSRKLCADSTDLTAYNSALMSDQCSRGGEQGAGFGSDEAQAAASSRLEILQVSYYI